MNNINNTIKEIILSQKDFHLLPRDKDGICIYDGNLIIIGLNISHLPDNLKVNGYLLCGDNQINEIPSGLYVGSDFSITNNNITSIPGDLIVVGDIYCSANKITNINKINYNQSLFINNNKLDRIPDGLCVCCKLDVSDNYIVHEIKAYCSKLIMDDTQKIHYNRNIKINKLKERMKNE